MPVITIRNVPNDLHEALTRLARRSGRSLQQQVLLLLQSARRLEGESPMKRARSIRGRLLGRNLGDTVSEVREVRRR